MNNKSKLKKELLELINNSDDEKLEYGKILEVAAELSTYDEENARFSVDGNLVKRLGEQLVAKKTTALSELIKNCYDAEASKVEVIFENTDQPGGTITILDNGHGMTREALINGFMKISTSDKEDNPVSPNYERARAGRKGIGRFAAQKIGNYLKIITRASADEPYLVVDFDWQDYKSNSNLLSIGNKVSISEDDYGFEKGTKLVISGTKEVWSEANQSTAFKYTSSVIKNTPTKLKNGLVDPGFSPAFYTKLPISDELLPIASDNAEFLNKAIAHIEASITENGNVKVNIKGIENAKLDDEYVINEMKSEVLKSAGFKFNAHYFNFGIGTSKYLFTYMDENSGIKLYRNGFYVAPYGNKYNDWLGLDDSVRRRKILPPHANANFIGGIDITDINGALFDETSGREGLIENNHFEELRNIAYELITSAVSRIASAQGKKVTASQKTGFRKKEPTIEEKIELSQSKLRATAEQIVNSTAKVETNRDLFTNDTGENDDRPMVDPEITVALQEGLIEQEAYIKELIDEKNMYRVLSSSGLAIGEFTHEIQLYLNALTLNGKQLRRSVSDNEEALRSAQKIESNIEMLVSYTDFFTDTIRNNSQRAKEVLEIREVSKMFFDAMQPTLTRRAYELITDFDGDDFWTSPMHISELSSVFINLFTNACKAIVRANPPNGKIKVAVKTVDDSHIIRFEDNGDGIPKENWGKVFSALFTTELSKGAYATEAYQMRGMGLGLTITQSIVDGFDGDIAVVDPSEGFNTCIQVIIPKAREEEIPENVY
ncbi:sensor histidine kinase [Vibrio mimicus]